jgi:lysophospholipase L1-like esterase
MDAFATSKSITGQEGDKFTLHIWTDPVNDLIEVVFINYGVGQGPSGNVVDIQHISLMDRSPIALADFPLRRISFTNTGTNATIESVVSCRKPVLAIGDSFVGTYSPPAQLTRVGAVLGAAFTETRYVINGGIAGNAVSRSSPGNDTSIRERWNAGQEDLEGVEPDQDLVAFRDVVCVFVNGPGLNDIIPRIDENSTENDINALAGRVSGDIERMAGDSIGRMLVTLNDIVSNDTVLCEQIPYAVAGAGLVNEKAAQAKINTDIKAMSNSLQIPIALVHDNYAANGGYSDSGTHPDVAGTAYIADQIADAYENNIIAPTTRGRSRIRNHGV